MLNKLWERSYFWLTNYLPDETTSMNAWHSLLDGMSYNVMVGLTQPFMNLFAMNLGATDPMLGYLSSWPALVGLLAQVPSALITERLTRIKKPLIVWCFLHRANYLIYALLPFLPIDGVYKAWIFVALVTAMNFPAVVVNTMWTHLMGNLFPGRTRARVFADRNFLTAIVTLIFLIIAGPILDLIPYPYNFSFNFGMGFLALMLSTWFLTKLKEEPTIETVAVQPEADKPKSSPWSGIGVVLKDRPFLGFVFASFVMHIGFGISGALWSIFYKRQLFMSNTEIGMISIVSTASSIIWYRFVPRIMDRLGTKKTFLLGITLFMPIPFLYGLVTPETLWLLWVFSRLDGMAGATYNLSFFNAILESSADEAYRPSYLAFFNTCISIASVILPIVGMQIYIHMGSLDVRPVFHISSLVRLSAVAMMFFILRDKQKQKATV